MTVLLFLHIKQRNFQTEQVGDLEIKKKVHLK